jgi:predicted Zn-dependent peptidase
MEYQLETLKNGLRVVLAPNENVESATVLVLVGAGSRYETKQNNGVSHFLEHMAFKGTAKRPTAREIANLLDSLGAESNAFTSKEMTGYYIKSASSHLPVALDVISDILMNSKFEQEEIDRERNVIIEEINLYEDTPMRKIGDIFENLLYGDTPMGWDIAGEKDIIRKLQRDDFVSYMNSLYSADNMILCVSGKYDKQKLLSDIEIYFTPFKKFPTKEFSRLTETQAGPQTKVRSKKTEQAHFSIGVRTVGLTDDKDRYPLSVLSAILGGGMSSRLFHEVRERRGLAYYVKTMPESYIDRGYITSFAGVDPKRIDEAIKVVIEEYGKMHDKDQIKEDELKKAKEYLKGHFILELEDTRAVALFYTSTLLLENKIVSPQEAIDKLEKVTLDDVYRVAAAYLLPDRLNLAIIGDYDDSTRFEKLLV